VLTARLPIEGGKKPYKIPINTVNFEGLSSESKHSVFKTLNKAELGDCWEKLETNNANNM
jgi:hypothetical protein